MSQDRFDFQTAEERNGILASERWGMSRPVGVVLAAVLLGIVAVVGILCTGFGLVMAIFTHNPILPGAFRPYAVFVNAVGLCFFMWCTWTSVDLLRMRIWARVSAAVIGLLFAVFCAMAGAGMLAARRFVPMLPPATQTVHVSSALVDAAAFCFVLAAIGLWWVIYFNLVHVRSAFGLDRFMVTNPEILPPGTGSDSRL